MAKKLTAVTNIKHNGEEIAAGSPVDASKFSKEQLKELFDNGAVQIDEEPDQEEQKGPETAAPEEPTAEAPKEPTTETPAAPAPTKATATKATAPTKATSTTDNK